jgi:hypothetical protein
MALIGTHEIFGDRDKRSIESIITKSFKKKEYSKLFTNENPKEGPGICRHWALSENGWEQTDFKIKYSESADQEVDDLDQETR